MTKIKRALFASPDAPINRSPDEKETGNPGTTEFKVNFPARARRQGADTVSITAAWGNDDAESTIVIARKTWEAIKAGCDHAQSGESWYEGSSEQVTWWFEGCQVSIDGEDGRQCVVDMPLNNLFVEP